MLKYIQKNMLALNIKTKRGFTLVEALVGAAVFMVLALSVYQTYTLVLNTVSNSQAKITATALANEQFEIARNLPYGDVGTIGGIPNGKIPASQNLTRDNKNFIVKTTIRSIDDPFDGTIGSSTKNDLSPADYKIVELEISCSLCKNFSPTIFTSNIGPRDLESESTNGSLFIRVFDMNALPLAEADVYITNTEIFPALSIADITNNDGLLQIVDAPPAINSYHITVSKNGYSSEQTYKTGELENPNPINPNPTVVLRQLTQTSFFLNYVRDLKVNSLDENCNPISDIDFTLKGTKLIGIEPDILKQNATNTTDITGEKLIPELDYDTYNLTMDNPNYILLGISTSTAITLNASSTGEVNFILAPKLTDSLLITVKDNLGLPISDANIELLQGTSTIATEITGPGLNTCRQNGQALFTNISNDDYDLIISKTGYQNYTESINLGSIWQEREIILNP
jgi:type II secretory pathway pseudopilin PulG